MNIYGFDRWNDLNEERITPLSLEKFKELLNKYAHLDKTKFLYKKIINPKTNIGIFYTSTKKFESHLDQLKKNIDLKGFPLRESSLVCYNYIEEEKGETFLIFPFNSSLFTIFNDKTFDNLSNECNKGYWKDRIKWLDGLNEREMWTDSPCLIIAQSVWNKLNI